MQPSTSSLGTATLILEFNCYVRDGNFATVWLLPRAFNEEIDYPEGIETTADIDRIVKVGGPLPLNEAEVLAGALESVLTQLGISIIRETWADD